MDYAGMQQRKSRATGTKLGQLLLCFSAAAEALRN